VRLINQLLCLCAEGGAVDGLEGCTWVREAVDCRTQRGDGSGYIVFGVAGEVFLRNGISYEKDKGLVERVVFLFENLIQLGDVVSTSTFCTIPVEPSAR
jgi:hypothetical protein